MIRIRDTIQGEPITFYFVESKEDLRAARRFVRRSRWLAFDTESTGINCYRRGWYLRTCQWGNDRVAYVVPARFRRFIEWAFQQPVKLIGHNGPHDVRSVDVYLGYETGRIMEGETYIPAHHEDSRGRDEGGPGLGLKEQAVKFIDPDAARWEKNLKKAFGEIKIPIEGQVYKSGPRKGTQKYRKAKVSEGYSLIPLDHPAFIAYAASDTILTYRRWRQLQGTVREFHELYRFDKKVAAATDRLQRRAMRLDVEYTRRLSKAYERAAEKFRRKAARYGCDNVQSGDQIAETLIALGVKLRAKTDSGKWKTDAALLRRLEKAKSTPDDAKKFIRYVLLAKQLEKRRTTYTDAMLNERDVNDRVHTSINSLAAVTTRMSASSPPLQQLPTKDHEEELILDDNSDD